MESRAVPFPGDVGLSRESKNFFDTYARGTEIDRNGWGTVQNFPARTQILGQDSPAKAVYMVIAGMVKLSRVTPNGGEIIVGIRRRPWLIGAPAVLLGRPYSFTVVTLISSSLRLISAKAFLQIVRENDQFSWQLHRLLSQEIFSQMKKVEAMSCIAAKERLKRFLYDLLREQESADMEKSETYKVQLQNIELAQIVGVSPEHLCRLLKGLEREGLITRISGILTVTDPSNLFQEMEQ